MKALHNRITCFLMICLSCLLLPGCDYETDNNWESVHALLFPNDGETLVQGNSYQVRWIDNYSNTLRIRLLRSGNIYVQLSEQVPNTGEFEWTIPDTLDEDDDYTIKILSNEDDFVYFESAKPFKILKQGDTASFTDIRDGQVYRTVKLAGRWWFAQNFNYDTIDSWCYGSDNAKCAEFGRLYTIGAAKDACPPGWHLPSDDEWQTLEAYLGIPLMDINTTGLRGINAGYLLMSENGVGFNAKYAGYVNTRNNQSYSLNLSTYFWTSTFENAERKYWVRQLVSYSDKIERSMMTSTYYALSVRYIRDMEQNE